jgi:thymidylate kinase
MEYILITGLDGSGKSTILDALSEYRERDSFDIIRLPHIETKELEGNISLKNTSEFVNAMSHEADLIKVPQVKAIAIFASMLLFREISRHKSKPGIRTLYCERHPLIDTGVYARFYAEKMGKGNINTDLLHHIDRNYGSEIEFLINLIPSRYRINEKGIYSLIRFITQWFFIDGKNDIANLTELFQVELPSKIYYLQARPEKLMKRLALRELHEAHESLEVLRALGHTYEKLFSDLSESRNDLVETIDANRTGPLFGLRERLLSSLNIQDQ